jgi:hypothetical protein
MRLPGIAELAGEVTRKEDEHPSRRGLTARLARRTRLIERGLHRDCVPPCTALRGFAGRFALGLPSARQYG